MVLIAAARFLPSEHYVSLTSRNAQVSRSLSRPSDNELMSWAGLCDLLEPMGRQQI